MFREEISRYGVRQDILYYGSVPLFSGPFVFWLAHKSGRRIDLTRIWTEQKCPPGLCAAIPDVLKEAHGFLTRQPGNPSEFAKKAECWENFRDKNIRLNETWERELAESAFVAPNSGSELLEAEWEKLRQSFTNDDRTIEALEAYTGKSWVRTRRRDTVMSYAVLTWEQLRLRPGLGPKKVRELVEMFAAALS